MFPSLYFPGFATPWGYPTVDGIYYNLIAQTFLDNYFCANYSTPPWGAPPFYLPPLWRYSFGGPGLTAFGFAMQDAAFNAEYWTDLNRTLRDSYYRGLLTASS